MDNENKYCYKYPHAALTADCVVFGFDGESLAVLLIERGIEPFKGRWALPGGFMRMDEAYMHEIEKIQLCAKSNSKYLNQML
ncbi:MAG: NUDIX domain-containing protein, partial [Muribaculaceae bacterium]|nr:NUDIX domain-containing protein [Muribaculaceae bacterium]